VIVLHPSRPAAGTASPADPALPQAAGSGSSAGAARAEGAVGNVGAVAAVGAAAGGGRFAGIEGLTMSRALFYLPGREEVYARVLGQLCENYGAGLPDLAPALAEGRIDAARRQLHALKGACGAVGAVAVMAQAQALEQGLSACVEGQAADPALRAQAGTVLQALAALLGTLRARLDGGPAVDVRPAVTEGAALGYYNRDALRAAVEELQDLFLIADFQSAQRLSEHEPVLRAAWAPEDLRRVQQALRVYDYDAALDALQQAQCALQARQG
jgi:HPt (histidine-containing phosphotransfer) domain-containing protein